ncbi:MAG: hypothetical protein QM820_65610 [Minicystis sp.]
MAHRFVAISVAFSIALGAADAAAQDEPPPIPVGLPPGIPGAPADPLPPPPGTTQLFSPVMTGIGGGLLLLGAVSLGVGIGAYTSNEKSVVTDIVRSIHGADTALMIGGGALMLIGIPLLAIGAHRVPVQSAPAAWWRPRVVAAPGGLGLGWVF